MVLQDHTAPRVRTHLKFTAAQLHLLIFIVVSIQVALACVLFNCVVCASVCARGSAGVAGMHLLVFINTDARSH